MNEALILLPGFLHRRLLTLNNALALSLSIYDGKLFYDYITQNFITRYVIQNSIRLLLI